METLNLQPQPETEVVAPEVTEANIENALPKEAVVRAAGSKAIEAATPARKIHARVELEPGILGHTWIPRDVIPNIH